MSGWAAAGLAMTGYNVVAMSLRRLSHNALVGSALALALLSQRPLAADSGVTSCAIRWDAWYSDRAGASALSTSRSLGPAKWHFRAPLHARIISENEIDWGAASQTTFDHEIEVASENNLTCWLYLIYGANDHVDLDASQMNDGLKFHLRSQIKDRVHYALIVPSSLMGRTDEYAAANSVIVKFMSDANYQSVLSGRPLLFIYYSTADVQTHWSGHLENLGRAIAALRQSAELAGLSNPYIVVTTRSDSVRRAVGADAMGAYNGPGAVETAERWDRYQYDVENFWSEQAIVTTKDSIPVVMTGWDQRPRFEHAPSFQTMANPEAAHGLYVQNPSNQQLVQAVQHAVTFVQSHSESTDPAQLLVIYSWNENDEGGNALNPTLGDPHDARLHALSPILQ